MSDDIYEAEDRLRGLTPPLEGFTPLGRERLRLAHAFLLRAHQDAQEMGLPWRNPHISGDNGDIEFEWLSASSPRRLVVSIEPRVVEYLRIWGPDMETQMADGVYEWMDGEFGCLWRWLHGEQDI